MPNLETLPTASQNAISSDDVLLGHEQSLGKTRLFTIGALVNVFKTGFGLGSAAFKDVGTTSNDVAAGQHGHTANQISGLGLVATSNSYPDLSDKPTLGTAAAKNTGTGANDVATGNHTHTADQISDFQTAARKALEYATGGAGSRCGELAGCLTHRPAGQAGALLRGQQLPVPL